MDARTRITDTHKAPGLRIGRPNKYILYFEVLTASATSTRDCISILDCISTLNYISILGYTISILSYISLLGYMSFSRGAGWKFINLAKEGRNIGAIREPSKNIF